MTVRCTGNGKLKSNISIVALLNDCIKRKDLCEGTRVHGDIRGRGLLERDPHVACTLVNMYAKCGTILKAQQVFDELPLQNVVSWSALITGYVHEGQGEEALNCFEQMQYSGLSPDAVTFVSVLKACRSISAMDQGQLIHEKIVCQGLPGKNVALGNALVDVYARCGLLDEAQKVLNGLPLRDVVSWSSLIIGYAEGEQGEKALKCFERMQCEGLTPDSITFICILKACGSMGAIEKGKEIQDKIVRQGLLGKDVVLDTALMDMYIKCGVLSCAQKLFDELPVRNVVSWSALIGGFTEQSQYQEALECFENLQHEGLFPNKVTFLCILRSCGNLGAADKGKQIHEEIVKQGLLGKDMSLGNALVDMYAKCGLIAKAKLLLDELPICSVVSWSAVIAGYAQQGLDKEAFTCFKCMKHEGIHPNAVTYGCILTAYGNAGALDKGKQIHDELLNQGLLGQDVVLGNLLVDMYVKCSALATAQQVLEKLPIQDVFSWNLLIAGYAEVGAGEEALSCFEQMQQQGYSPDTTTFSCILKACGSMGAIDKGKQIHEEIVKQGLLGETITLGNALMDMYVKCGDLPKARQLLTELPARDTISWNVLISGYAQLGEGEESIDCFMEMQLDCVSPDAVTFVSMLKACGTIGEVEEGKQIHSQIICRGLLETSIVLGNALVDMYAKCSALYEAQQVLDMLPVRDMVPWSALIAGYSYYDRGEEALRCFDQMQSEALFLDSVTLVCLLRTCGSIGAVNKGRQIHDKFISQDLLKDVVLGTALVDMYAKCGMLAKADQVLSKLPVRNVISWNVLITGYAQQEQGEEVLNCVERMQYEGFSPDTATFIHILKACGSVGAVIKGKEFHEEIVHKGLLGNDLALDTALVDMYARCGELAKAQEVLKELPVRDVVTWNALITGYAHQEQAEDALNCFELMQQEGLPADSVTFACISKVCGSIGAADKGRQIHDEIVKVGLMEDGVVLGSALVDMYAKFGMLAEAQHVLNELPVRNVVSWNALMTGFAQQVKGDKALECFNQMLCEGLFPDSATFTCLLSACSRSGFLVEGKIHMENMSKQFGIIPAYEHLTCMVDLFSRRGHFDEAIEVLRNMPILDHQPAWSAFLSACKRWGNVKLAAWAFKCAAQVSRCGFNTFVHSDSYCENVSFHWNAEKVGPGIWTLYGSHGPKGFSLGCVVDNRV